MAQRWERKRGKLEDFKSRLLAGDPATSFMLHGDHPTS